MVSQPCHLVRPKVSNSPGVGCITAPKLGSQRALGPQGVGGLRASGWRSSESEPPPVDRQWRLRRLVRCMRDLPKLSMPRSALQRPADESVSRRAPADRIVSPVAPTASGVLRAMRINHSAIRSTVYELVKVVEFELTLDDSWPIRFEIFKDTERERHFRCRMWQLERHEIQPTFPQDEHGRPRPDHLYSPLIAVNFSGPKMGNYDDIVAADADAALAMVIEDLKRFLERVTLEEAK